MPMASVQDAKVYYELHGTGSPLVLTAGQGTGPEARAALVAGLARQHRVLTYDQRGTGRSERVAQGQPIEELADDIVALMDDAGFARAHVVGVSTGTGKATSLAVRHPSRVEKLVLAAPWTHGDAALHTIQNLRKAAARTMPPDHYVQFNALLLYTTEYRRQHAARFDELARRALGAPQDAAGTAARLDAILRFDARPLYPRVAAPTLVVGIRDDLVMPPWHAEEAARTIPGARLALLEHGGHLFAESDPEAFLAHALPFLA